MFAHADLKGNDLPPKALSLTFDDGPGPQTIEIGDFLAERGIRAAFFVVGSWAAPAVLDRLCRQGHLVGNHTYTHPGLVRLALSGGDVVGEIAQTEARIAPFRRGPALLRAPYGNWRETDGPSGADKPVSIVADVLNRTDLAQCYAGPVNWDICGEDWTFWERGDSGAACARRYLAEVEAVGRGIILMHDGSDDPTVRGHNRALDAVRVLVPALLERSYRFVRVDEVPQVRSAAAH